MSKMSELLGSIDIDPAEIAHRSGLPLDRVVEIVNGSEASVAELRSIATALRIPLGSFAAGVQSSHRRDDIRLLFRQTGRSAKELDPTREYVSSFVISALEILPSRDSVPAWMADLIPSEETFEEADDLAHAVRKRLYPDNMIEPISDLAGILGSQGEIIVSKLYQSRFEGVSLIAGNTPFIFISPRFPGRMLFTLAHELGHILAHHRHQNEAIFEKASDIGGSKQRKREAFVDAFASLLLMPAQGVGRMLHRVRSQLGIDSANIGDIEILLLARFFGVSFDVAARRCEVLELLPPGGAISLTAEIKNKFGSPEKRAESAGLPPRVDILIPKLSSNLMQHILQELGEGRISIGWVSDRFGVSISEIFAARKSSSRERDY